MNIAAILSLLQLALTLLVSIQAAPNIDPAFREAAVSIANQAIQIATKTIQQNRNTQNQPTEQITTIQSQTQNQTQSQNISLQTETSPSLQLKYLNLNNTIFSQSGNYNISGPSDNLRSSTDVWNKTVTFDWETNKPSKVSIFIFDKDRELVSSFKDDFYWFKKLTSFQLDNNSEYIYQFIAEGKDGQKIERQLEFKTPNHPLIFIETPKLVFDISGLFRITWKTNRPSELVLESASNDCGNKNRISREINSVCRVKVIDKFGNTNEFNLDVFRDSVDETSLVDVPTITAKSYPYILLGEKEYIKFTIYAGKNDMEWKKIEFSVSVDVRPNSTIIVPNSLALRYDTSDGNLINLQNGSISPNGGEGIIELINPERIRANSSRTYSLSINVSSRSDALSLVVIIKKDEAEDDNPSSYSEQIADGDSFIWSNLNAKPHSTYSADWYNGFKVQGIPSRY